MTDPEVSLDIQRLRRLLLGQRWAALGTVEAGVPYVSWVAYALGAEPPTVVFHLSRLAQHTRNLLETPDVSLALTEPDAESVNPQQLARLSLQGQVRPVARGAPEYDALRESYLLRFPKAALTFGFGDFELFRFGPVRGRYVEGFGRTYELDGDGLRAVFQVDVVEHRD